jgi:hypothetical protein
MLHCATELLQDHRLEDDMLNTITAQLKAFAETGFSYLEHNI